ncbi:hypothetical protein [Halorubellus litoreus]|uniref:Uncharacterized protein n=1 Tax=Halorubellus litoreus TaxID=755308 RepID=A0ABD5VHA0_9EURY
MPKTDETHSPTPARQYLNLVLCLVVAIVSDLIAVSLKSEFIVQFLVSAFLKKIYQEIDATFLKFVDCSEAIEVLCEVVVDRVASAGGD